MVKTIETDISNLEKPSKNQYIPLWGIIEAMKANGRGEPSIMPDGRITLAGLYQATLYASVVGGLYYLLVK